jgi:hypothetical protein
MLSRKYRSIFFPKMPIFAPALRGCMIEYLVLALAKTLNNKSYLFNKTGTVAEWLG